MKRSRAYLDSWNLFRDITPSCEVAQPQHRVDVVWPTTFHRISDRFQRQRTHSARFLVVRLRSHADAWYGLEMKTPAFPLRHWASHYATEYAFDRSFAGGTRAGHNVSHTELRGTRGCQVILPYTRDLPGTGYPLSLRVVCRQADLGQSRAHHAS